MSHDGCAASASHFRLSMACDLVEVRRAAETLRTPDRNALLLRKTRSTP